MAEGISETSEMRGLSPPFEPPTYTISIGEGGALQWDPPVDSIELGLALSYHYPRPSKLEDKMKIAMEKFLKAREKNNRDSVCSGQERSLEVVKKSRQWTPPVSVRKIERTLRHKNGRVSSARVRSEDQNAIDSTDYQESASPSFSPQVFPDKSKRGGMKSSSHTRLDLPGMSIFRLGDGEQEDTKRKKRRYSDEEKAKVAKNRGKACDFHRGRKQKCDPTNCRQNRQYLDDGYSLFPLRDLRGHNPDDDHTVSLPIPYSGSLPTTNIQEPPVPLPRSTCQQQKHPKGYGKPDAQHSGCQPAATQGSLSSSSTDLTPTDSSISEVDSKPFAVKDSFPVVVKEGLNPGHVTQLSPPNSWGLLDTYLNDTDDPYIKVLEANPGGGVQPPSGASIFEDRFFEYEYVNINNITIELGQNDYSNEIMEGSGFKDMAHSGTVSNADSGLQASIDTISHASSYNDFEYYLAPQPPSAHHEMCAAASFTSLPQPQKEKARLTNEEENIPGPHSRLPTPSGYESVQYHARAKTDKVRPPGLTGGAQEHHGQSYCDRGVVEPYPNPPGGERQSRYMPAQNRDQAFDNLVRRCSTVSAASTRNSYGRDMYDSGLLATGTGIGRRASAISSTSQSSRFSTLYERGTTNTGAGVNVLSPRRYSDDLRRRESQNSATSSRRGVGPADELLRYSISGSSHSSRSRRGSGLFLLGMDRRADAAGVYSRNSMYGSYSSLAAARAGSGAGAGDGAGKSEHEKTLDILVEKMSGARIQC